jgi:hypothetical protein
MQDKQCTCVDTDDKICECDSVTTQYLPKCDSCIECNCSPYVCRCDCHTVSVSNQHSEQRDMELIRDFE